MRTKPLMNSISDVRHQSLPESVRPYEANYSFPTTFVVPASRGGRTKISLVNPRACRKAVSKSICAMIHLNLEARERRRWKTSNFTEGASPRRKFLSLSRWPHGTIRALGVFSIFRLYTTCDPMILASLGTFSGSTVVYALRFFHFESSDSNADWRSS